MYNKFFGFKEKPFKLVPNPEYLFLSKSHEEALGHLTYAISHGDGFVEITGEVGTGKTTLCRVFLGSLDTSIDAAYIFNPKLDGLQLLKAINDEFGIDSKPGNTKDLIDILNGFLIEKKAAGQKVLVLIDEAQNLSLEVLEQLRLLSNLETTQEKLLQIILVGQPELGDILSSHQLRQLGQRITINCQLEPLTFQEAKDYIRHRISLASHRAGPPFDKASYRAIYEYSQGIPRLINIACNRVLLNAFSHNSFKITGSITKEALKELTRKKTGSSSGKLLGTPGLIIVSAVFVSLVILLLYLANGNSPGISAISKSPAPERVSKPETEQTIPVGKQIPGVSEPSVKPVTPQTEEPIAIQDVILPPNLPEGFENSAGDIALHSIHVGTFPSASQANERVEEIKALGFPSFMYTQEKSSGEAAFMVVAGKYQSYNLAKEASMNLSDAGYSNFIARAKHSLATGTAIVGQPAPVSIIEEQPQQNGATQNFLNYLKGLNSRSSRNNSMEEILKLWFPAAEIHIKQNRIDTNRLFFQEAAKEYGLQVQPVATESDLALIQTLNLPAIFTFYLPGHTWPKYLAAASLDKEKIYFVAGEQNQTVSVDRDMFLQYWSGEAYIFWKNFKEINGMITGRSSGHDVKSLKSLLFQLGYDQILLTEKYDKGTMVIIKDIQAKYGFHVDGLVGPLTKIALYNESLEFAKPSLVKFETSRTENGS